MQEEWRPVKGYEGLYEVSSFGRVRRLDGHDSRGHFIKGRVLKERRTTNGYVQVQLSNGKSKEYRVHRLVATAFHERPEGKTEVNHINEIKTDNRAENLEWVTKTENQNHGTLPERMRNRPDKIGRTQSKAVVQLSALTGERIAEFPSAAAAERCTGIKAQNIGSACRHPGLVRGGYCWKFKTE